MTDTEKPFAPACERNQTAILAILRQCLRSSDQKVLEVGSGNGALSVLLGNEGMRIRPLDIADKSLFEKIKVACWHMTILCAPILVGLGVFYIERLYIILLILCTGYLCLTTIVMAKYSAYPGKISLPQGIMLAVGIWFPPLLFGIIPYFYFQAVKRLQTILA